MKQDTTILLPARNEEESIGKLVKEWNLYSEFAKVLVVNNNSTDRTQEEAEKAGATVLFEPRKGKGNAVRTGITYIDTPYTIMMDSDMTYPVNYALIARDILISNHHPDVVVGYRDHLDSGSMSRMNKFGNKCLSLLASTLYFRNVEDLCTGLWGFKTYALRGMLLESDGFTLEAELFVQMCKKRFVWKQFPIEYRKRVGDSKLKIKDGLKIGWFLVQKRF